MPQFEPSGVVGAPKGKDAPSSSASAGGGAQQRPGGLAAKYAAAIDGGVFFAFIALLAWAPLWFGSNRPLAWGVNAIGFGGLAVCYELALLATRRRHPVALRRLWFPVLAFAFVFVWSLFQISPMIPKGYQHLIWQMAGEALARELPGSISVDHDDTIVSLLRFATCGFAFYLALQLGRSSRRARRLTQAVAVIGAFYATYGIIAFFVFPRSILWFDKLYYLDSVTSTFINRNSYATYAGIGLVCSLTIVLHLYLGGAALAGGAVGRKIASLVSITVGQGGAWIACAFIIGVALVLTGSRGGVLASVSGLFALLILSGVRGRRHAVATGFGSLAIGLAIGGAFFNYGDFLADRLATQGLASDDRLAVYGLTWNSIGDAPLLGFGDGTFEKVFPLYRDKTIDMAGLWDKAHNSYLEALQGLGVPVASILLIAIAVLFGRCVHAALTRRNSTLAPLAASAATVIVSLHALVDFSLQIEAVALTWAALLGAGTAQSWRSKVATDR